MVVSDGRCSIINAATLFSIFLISLSLCAQYLGERCVGGINFTVIACNTLLNSHLFRMFSFITKTKVTGHLFEDLCWKCAEWNVCSTCCSDIISARQHTIPIM